jgi:hypothetical protein
VKKVLLCIVGCALLVALAIWWRDVTNLLRIASLLPRPAEVMAVELNLGRDVTGKEKTLVRDQDKIAQLISILTSGRQTEDHKCSDVGSIIFHLRSGRTVELLVLPGHDPEYYEFRTGRPAPYGIYRVPRKAFINCLEGMGITDIPQQTRSHSRS